MNTLAHMISSTLSANAVAIQMAELSAVVGALALVTGAAKTAREEAAPVTIRSGCFLASGLTVQVAA